MAHDPDKKYFGGEVSQELSDRIDRWIVDHADAKKRQIAITLAEFFLALPEPLQGYLLIAPIAFAKTVQIVTNENSKRMKADEVVDDVKGLGEVAADAARITEANILRREGDWLCRSSGQAID